MGDYVIFTDTNCDIPTDMLEEWKVSYLDLLLVDDAAGKTLHNSEMKPKDFYKAMRDGVVYKTMAANPSDFNEAFTPALKEGKDIIYLGFSGGLSNSINASRIAADELKEAFPDRKIVIIDSLCASAGEGLFVYLCVKRRDEGMDIDTLAKYAEEIVPNICHWFTVEDLVYLKRGGRVSAASAFIGGVLNVKPVLHVDDEGHLVNVFKVRGRKQSLAKIAEKYFETALDTDGEYFISHGDSLEDAEALEKMIMEKTGNAASLICDIGPVIGSHAGPGTIAFFYLGKNR